ncbi:hypothetical protein, partial [Klebsiella aerogenes]|uniref:hypothetical protein n=1 Tax=Klebsiella aerogenes TaxID=548 RepID=UPI0019549529
MGDRADDTRLAVFPVHGFDARHIAQPLFDAVGRQQQARAQRLVIAVTHREVHVAIVKTMD